MRCRGVYTLLCGLILVATVAAAANKESVVQLMSRAEQGDIKAQAELCGKYTKATKQGDIKAQAAESPDFILTSRPHPTAQPNQGIASSA